jgi:prefoldin subunit 5
MSSADIVKALGPGIHLSKLDQFSSSYNTVTTNFTSLLQYPFLQDIVLSESPSSPGQDQDLRSIVADGSSRFGQLCTTNISIAQQVASYGRTVPLLLKALTIASYTSSTKPLIDQYVNEAQASAGNNEQFFEDLQTYLQLLNDQIALMTGKIDDLTTKIKDASAELAKANVGQVIGDLIKSLFKVASGEEGDVQIATLLTVGIDTLKSDFTQLWADQARLTALIKGLTALKSNLSAIKALFSALSKALTGVITDSKSLLSTWSDVASRLETVNDVDRKATDSELQLIVAAWNKAQAAATAYVNAVSGSGSTTPLSGRALFAAARAAAPHYTAKMPRSKGELKMASLITSLDDVHPETVTVGHVSLAANPNVNESDKDKILKAAGPPAQTQAVLDQMADQTAGVLKQFNDLLRIPFLNQLQCNDPDKPSDKINIQTMVTNYQKMYYDLQQTTVPLAQDLQTYSNAQLALLPRLVSTSSAGPGQITVATYLSANGSLTQDYKTKADAIFNASLTYKQQWNNAINAVLQAINECKTNITTWQATIDDLSDQVKQLTLKAVLMGVGALLCFAAAAFLPGGLLVSGALIAGGIALIGMTIDAIDQIGKLLSTINELKAQIQIAQDTQAKLEILLPFMQKIADSLTDIAGVWKDITQDLNDIIAWNLLLANPGLLSVARPALITSWTGIQQATQKYMNIITGQGTV